MPSRHAFVAILYLGVGGVACNKPPAAPTAVDPPANAGDADVGENVAPAPHAAPATDSSPDVKRIAPQIQEFAKPLPTEVQKLQVTQTHEIELGEAKALILNPQPAAQTITVEFTSSNGPVQVLVFNDVDLPDSVDGLLTADSKKAIAVVTAVSGKLVVEVPAKTGTQIVIRNAKGREHRSN